MIKLAQALSAHREFQFRPKDHTGKFDHDFFKKSMKRIGPIKIRTGITSDDFFFNRYSVIMEARGVRIPRFMNPVRGRRHGKAKSFQQKNTKYDQGK